jgi:CTP synthase
VGEPGRRVEAATDPGAHRLIGKYVELPDAYLSVVEALRTPGSTTAPRSRSTGSRPRTSRACSPTAACSRDLDGIVIPGGFGERGIEGKIAAARYAREHEVPCLGLCLGLQAMTIEFARNVLGLTGANSTEFDPTPPTR